MTSERDANRAEVDRLLAEALVASREPFADEDAAPSEELIAWSLGEATPVEQARVEAILAKRPDLADALGRVPHRSSRARRWPWLAGFVAACVPTLLFLRAYLTVPEPVERHGSELAAALGERRFERADEIAARLIVAGTKRDDPFWSTSPSHVRSAFIGRPPSGVTIASPGARALSDRPRIRWTVAEDALGVPLTLRVEDSEQRVLFLADVAGRELPWPEHVTPLARGEPYCVLLQGPTRESPWACVTFEVADEETRRALAAELAAIDASVDDARARRFARARLLARAGFDGDAFEELAPLVDALDAADRSAFARFLRGRGATRLADLLARSVRMHENGGGRPAPVTGGSARR